MGFTQRCEHEEQAGYCALCLRKERDAAVRERDDLSAALAAARRERDVLRRSVGEYVVQLADARAKLATAVEYAKDTIGDLLGEPCCGPCDSYGVCNICTTRSALAAIAALAKVEGAP